MSDLATRVREGLLAVANPSRAPAMQAYMKSAMPFLGVTTPPRRALCRELFAPLSYADAGAWQADVLALWRGARWREERYAAIALTGIRQARLFQRIAALPMYEEMVVTGGWWDLVDEIATHRLGAILRNDREPAKAAMLAWAEDANLWKRRCAILCQNGTKAATDLDFLHACIAPSITSREFFLRKAIGWALRQYAWTNPAAVIAYVEAHPDLSGLSRREALKNIRP